MMPPISELKGRKIGRILTKMGKVTREQVNEALGLASVESLKKLGYQPEYSHYPMPHSVCPQEIMDISAWLQRVLS